MDRPVLLRRYGAHAPAHFERIVLEEEGIPAFVAVVHGLAEQIPVYGLYVRAEDAARADAALVAGATEADAIDEEELTRQALAATDEPEPPPAATADASVAPPAALPRSPARAAPPATSSRTCPFCGSDDVKGSRGSGSGWLPFLCRSCGHRWEPASPR